jgi:hypothetical protein
VRNTDPVTADTSDLRAAASFGGRGLAGATGMIRDLHLAIANRAFTMTGPPAAPVRLLHDGISRGVYAAVGGATRAFASAAGVAVAARAAADSGYRPLADRPAGNVVLGALNGAWGDLLQRTRSPLALTMSVRSVGASAAVTGDVAVWLHGLCETDASWRLGAPKHYDDPRSTHGDRLHREVGLTPVFLRYNTGLHVSENGAQLSDLLDLLVADWPVPVTRLTLVGHSMGGLVIRSACHRGTEQGSTWVPLVRRVVYLGSPHLGAPLEVGAAAATRALRRLPETQPVARALATRSVGIKDLRFGDVLADDWAALTDLDDIRAEPQTCPALLECADHYYIGATIGRRHDTVAARVLGDALVPFASASGEGKVRRLGLAVDRGRHLGGLHHFDLLNHPRVYAVLRDWLGDWHAN